MLILRPVPSLILGNSNEETLEPNLQVTDFGAWFSGLLAYAPSAYVEIDSYLKQVMPDLIDMKNPLVGKDSRSLEVQFSNGQGSATFPFEDLSAGEKCFMICALVLAANKAYGPAFWFWDEPDNYLAISEVILCWLFVRRSSLAVSLSRPRTIPRRSAVFQTRIHLFFTGTTTLSQRKCVHSRTSRSMGISLAR